MSKLVRKAKEAPGAVPPPGNSLFLADNRAEFERRLFKLADKFSVVTYRYSERQRRRVIERQEYDDFALACIMAVSSGDDAMVYAIGNDEAFGLGCMIPKPQWAEYLVLWREMKNIPSSSSIGGRFPPNETPHMDFPVRDEIKWNWKLEGTKCPSCNGTGSSFEQGDAHRSPGFVPCPRGYFQGHGNPVCNKGKLRFSDYDKKHWPGTQVGETMNDRLWKLMRGKKNEKKAPNKKGSRRR